MRGEWANDSSQCSRKFVGNGEGSALRRVSQDTEVIRVAPNNLPRGATVEQLGIPGVQIDRQLGERSAVYAVRGIRSELPAGAFSRPTVSRTFSFMLLACSETRSRTLLACSETLSRMLLACSAIVLRVSSPAAGANSIPTPTPTPTPTRKVPTLEPHRSLPRMASVTRSIRSMASSYFSLAVPVQSSTRSLILSAAFSRRPGSTRRSPAPSNNFSNCLIFWFIVFKVRWEAVSCSKHPLTRSIPLHETGVDLETSHRY